MAVFTDRELETLVLALAPNPGDELTEDDAQALIAWAEQTRIANSLIDLALQGRMSVQMQDAQPVFRRR